MDWHIALGIIAGIIQVAAMAPYLKSILKRETKPNIVTWTLWTCLQLIALMAQFSHGASWSVIWLVATTFNTSLVVILCLLGYGYGKIGRVEKVCFFLCVVAVGFWQLTAAAALAIGFSILADVISAVPTLVKTWKEPETETPFPWFMVSFAALLGAFSTTIFNFENLAFSIYLTILNGSIALLAARPYISRYLKK